MALYLSVGRCAFSKPNGLTQWWVYPPGEAAVVSDVPIMRFPAVRTAHANSDRQNGTISFKTAFDRAARLRAGEYQGSHDRPPRWPQPSITIVPRHWLMLGLFV
jgi:hypothetical protein